MSYRTRINLIIVLLQIGFVVLYTIVFSNDVALFVAGWGDDKLNISIIYGISMLFYLSLYLIMNKSDKLNEQNKKNEAKSAAVTVVTIVISNICFFNDFVYLKRSGTIYIIVVAMVFCIYICFTHYYSVYDFKLNYPISRY